MILPLKRLPLVGRWWRSSAPQRGFKMIARRGLSFLLQAGFVMLLCCWLVGQITRDRNLLTGLLFYIPAPCVLGAGLAAGLHALYRRKGRPAVFFLLGCLLPLYVVADVDNQWAPPAIAAPSEGLSLRLIHWNIAWGWKGWEVVSQQLEDYNADIQILSEVPQRITEGFVAARTDSERDVEVFAPMIAVSRGQLGEFRWLLRARDLHIGLFPWTIEGQTVHIMAVDLPSDPLAVREESLGKLLALMEEHAPDLVVGDFNAPRRSRAISPLPAGYVHAYEAAGSGWSYTWPSPVPVLAIDQCIVSDRLEPQQYRLISSLHSDHCMQVFDFRVPYKGTDTALKR